jgi:hypothetical protein
MIEEARAKGASDDELQDLAARSMSRMIRALAPVSAEMIATLPSLH